MSVSAQEILHLSVKPEDRVLFDRAATIQRKTRTDFILDAARSAAEEALVDRAIVRVSAKIHARFVALLDARPSSNARLRRTLRTKAPWE